MRGTSASKPVAGYELLYTPREKRLMVALSESSLRSPKKARTAFQRKNSTGFQHLHNDLLLSILVSSASTASSPADLINTMLVCKRFHSMGTHPVVLANACIRSMAVKPVGWSEGAHRFLKRCADAGNVEACFALGMIRFYCLGNTVGGVSLMARAAMASHAGALHSLAVIQFNGSGGTRKDKDLKAGVALCARAASLGDVDAMRELGHCLQDGYGVVTNIFEGRRLLLEANAREAAAAVSPSSRSLIETALKLKMSTRLCMHHLCLHHRLQCLASQKKEGSARKLPPPENTRAAVDGPVHHPLYRLLQRGGCSLLSDFGCNVPPAKVHFANSFLVGWFSLHPLATGLRLCSQTSCGRPETRRHEFRRCSACGKVNYCSRACQALDWKTRHKYDCQPSVDWEDEHDTDTDIDEADEDDDEDDPIGTEDVED